MQVVNLLYVHLYKSNSFYLKNLISEVNFSTIKKSLN